MKSNSTGSKAGNFRASFMNYLKDFGTKITHKTFNNTYDSMNRLTDSTEVTQTLFADIQWVTKKDLNYLNLGKAELGDGLVFVSHDSGIQLEDEITFNNNTWRILEQIEGEQVKGEVVYTGFIIRKNA